VVGRLSLLAIQELVVVLVGHNGISQLLGLEYHLQRLQAKLAKTTQHLLVL
jgi:hypothetical protein